MDQYRIKELFVEITNYCLQGCVHCSSCAGPANYQSIPINKLRSLIEETLPLGLESFTISGGEPLLYPELVSLVSFIKEKGLSFNLYTCGVCEDINKKPIPLKNDLLDVLLENGINKLIFSLQGGNVTSHERVSSLPGSFSITLQSIKKAICKSIPVELHFVPMTINHEEISSVVKLAANYGIKQVSLLRLVPQGRCDDYLMLSQDMKENLITSVEKLQELYPTVSIRLGTPFNCITLSSKECTAAKNKLLISASGDIFPCEAFKYLKGHRPTIYNTSIRDAWFNDKLLNSIRDLEKENVEHCKNCSLFESCKAGCHGQRLRHTGNLLIGPDPDCSISGLQCPEVYTEND